jgi:hypothetical protein
MPRDRCVPRYRGMPRCRGMPRYRDLHHLLPPLLAWLRDLAVLEAWILEAGPGVGQSRHQGDTAPRAQRISQFPDTHILTLLHANILTSMSKYVKLCQPVAPHGRMSKCGYLEID